MVYGVPLHGKLIDVNQFVKQYRLLNVIWVTFSLSI